MRIRLGYVGGVAAAMLFAIPATASAADRHADSEPPPLLEEVALAEFAGALITMDEVWEMADACLVWPEVLPRPECFDSEEDMNLRIAELEVRRAEQPGATTMLQPTAGVLASECSGWLRLYDGTSYTGQTMSVKVRLEWLNLASFGFDQRTSSFKVGPCSAYFADWSNGGGDWYPTYLTEAYDVASSMVSGWNNDVSSIYIN